MISEVFVWVFLPGDVQPVVCGRIDLGVSGNLSFTYGRTYRERPNAIDLAPEKFGFNDVPLMGRTVGSLPGPLRDAAPDSWGRRVILYRRKMKEASELEYLLESVGDRIGSLLFSRTSKTPPDIRDEEPISLAKMEDAARGVEGSVKLAPELDAALNHGTAVGGARPKVTFRDEQGMRWIAKFSSTTDEKRVVRWEAATMKLARLAGINVPETRLTRVNGRDALLVHRFDRIDAAKDTHRRMILSALTLLDLDETEASLASYPDFSEVLLRHDREHNVARAQLYRRMVFNILIGNTDDHARNHACFWDGRQLQLTQAYDLSPVSRVGQEARQAMIVGADGSRESTLRNALSAARRFGLTTADAEAVIEETVTMVRDHWRQCFIDAGVPEMEIDGLDGRAVLSPVALLIH